MFAARSAAQRGVRAMRTAAHRIHTVTPPTHASMRVIGCGVSLAGAAALALAVHHQRQSMHCAPAAPAPLPEPTLESIPFYQPTRSDKLSRALPDGPSSVAAASLPQLAQIFDPTQTDADTTGIAHAFVWGAPPPEHALPALPLLFTAAEPEAFRRHMELLVRSIQNRICNDLLEVENFAADRAIGSEGAAATLESLDGRPIGAEARQLLLCQTDAPGRMRENIVVRPNGTGGGIERVLQGGRVFSKAGVNCSVSNVSIPAERFHVIAADHPSLDPYKNYYPKENIPLWTGSISLVLHAVSPHVPTVHANYRYFEMILPGEIDGKKVHSDASLPIEGQPGMVRHWWFGGGSDLTPTYVEDVDATHFHSVLKRTLARVAENKSLYPAWKTWCDAYFRSPHRAEARGIGGVFFDDIQSPAPASSGSTDGRDQWERVLRALGESFSASYFPLVLKRMSQPFSVEELAFQQLRRGRYAEYNLVYDRGTSYGLKASNGRPEAILMSLPPVARFAYRQNWNTDTRSKYTKQVLTTPKEW